MQFLVAHISACTPASYVTLFLFHFKHAGCPTQHWFWQEALNRGLNFLVCFDAAGDTSLLQSGMTYYRSRNMQYMDHAKLLI